MCYVSFGGIPFRSLYIHVKTSLNSFNNYSASSCGFALIPKLKFINCWSLVNVHPIICNSCVLIFVGVLSTITLLG